MGAAGVVATDRAVAGAAETGGALSAGLSLTTQLGIDPPSASAASSAWYSSFMRYHLGQIHHASTLQALLGSPTVASFTEG
jgi:hypothetical protein